MPSTLALAAAGVVAAYAFLRALAVFLRDPREPKAVIGTIPFISPLIGMLVEKGGYYMRLRDSLKLPIYTLCVPGPPIYVVNSLALIQRIDRHILTVAFAPIQVRACEKAMGVGESGMAKIKKDTLPRAFAPAAAPGPGLDALNRAAVGNFAASFDKIAAERPKAVNLFHWIRHEIFAATMDASYGPRNPFRNPKNEAAWFDFEEGIMPLLMDVFPGLFARKSLKALDHLVKEFTQYFKGDGHLDGSLLVKLREKHNAAFGLDTIDTAHCEIGQVAGGVVNTAPTVFWLVWQVLADPVVFADCRAEVAKLVRTDADGHHTIDLAEVRTECPILLSTWQEVLRYHGISIAARIVQEDTMVDDQFLLKKGGVVMMPNAVIHSDQSLWGPTVGQFNHKRFLKTNTKDGGTRRPAAAFRGFGSGHVLCPGRHFASTEALTFLALVLARFDVRPVAGEWTEPKKDMVMDRACPLPKTDVFVELLPRDDKEWRVVFSDTRAGINIVAEDLGEA
ncbi:Cytochrome P450 [Apiospora rasikravindrae]|uniref:Cytochrome P450 n=1 Tax=Apiospora rasikravindrae TaxID=990691 RepID=A0ABR1TDV8_9PEZI